MRDYMTNAPDELGLWLLMRKAPASPALPKEMHGRPVVAIAVCYAGSDGAAGEVVGPVRQFGSRVRVGCLHPAATAPPFGVPPALRTPPRSRREPLALPVAASKRRRITPT